MTWNRTWAKPSGPSLTRSTGGLILTCGFAIGQQWSLPEFCWGVWVCGLVFAWSCVATASLHLVLTSDRQRTAMLGHAPVLARVPRWAFTLGLGLVVAACVWVSFRVYCFLFAFYGLFLSVFCEMQPDQFFGRNGFINSDFYTPVAYLLVNYWPMVAATLICNGEALVGPHPWRRILAPLEADLVRLHLMVLAMPIVSLLAWAVVGDSYQTVVVVALLAGMHLLPLVRRAASAGAGRSEQHHADEAQDGEDRAQGAQHDGDDAEDAAADAGRGGHHEADDAQRD